MKDNKLWNADGTIDLYAVCNRAGVNRSAEPLPSDATPAERAAWMIARQLETASTEFEKLHDSMLKNKGILSDHEIERLQKLGELLSKLRKAHVANMVQAGKSQKEVAEATNISCGRVSQIVKEVGIPERYLSRIIGDNVAGLLLKAPEQNDGAISEVVPVNTPESTSELQHLLELGFPLATKEELAGTTDKEPLTPASFAKLPQSWIQTPIPPCSFYDNLLDRYDHYLSEDVNLPETGYQSASHLRGMITQLRYDTSQSLTKKHRWLGYIQGVMCAYHLIDVDTERDWTRGLFNGA